MPPFSICLCGTFFIISAAGPPGLLSAYHLLFSPKFPSSCVSTVENKQTLISMCDPLVVNRLIST